MRKMDLKKWLVGPALIAATLGTAGCQSGPTGTSPLQRRYESAPEVSMLSWAGVKAQSREEARASILEMIKPYTTQGYSCGTPQRPCKGQAGGARLGQRKVSSIYQEDWGVSWGDPHFATYDMTKYRNPFSFYFSNNQIGNTVLARSVRQGDPIPYELRARQHKQPSNGWVVNKAASLRVGVHTVVLDVDAGALVVDGRPVYPQLNTLNVLANDPSGTLAVWTNGQVFDFRSKAPTLGTEDQNIFFVYSHPEVVGLAINILHHPGSGRRGTIIGSMGKTDLDSVTEQEQIVNDFILPNGVALPVADLDGNNWISPEEILRFNAFAYGSLQLSAEELGRLNGKIDYFTASWMAPSL